MTTKTLPTLGASLDTAAASLPYGFLEALCDHGEKSLGDWLRENAPDHVAELFDSLIAVRVRSMALRSGDGNSHTDSSLLEWVASIACCAAKLDVQWTGPYGEIYGPGKLTIKDDEDTEEAAEPAAD